MKLHGLQILRAIAALLVVADHSLRTLVRTGAYPEVLMGIGEWLGRTGVCLFFVISGFVMMLSHEKDFGKGRAPSNFIRKRLTRIVPLYWLTTAIYVARLIQSDRAPAVDEVIKSLLFIPYQSESGLMQPVYGLGWTLNYEMYFYGVLAVGLLAPPRFGPWLVSTAVVLVTALGYLFDLPLVVEYWARPISLFFVMGLMLGLLWQALPRKERPDGDPGALLGVGVFLGNASYSIYLTHSFVVGPAARFLGEMHTDPVVVLLLLVPVCALVGGATHVWVERPLLKFTTAAGRAPSPA